MIRIGSVPYLNAKPLVCGLDREPEIKLMYDVPSKLAGMLKDGQIAAGMVSSVACFMNPDLQIVPGISISCVGRAESVKLFYNKDIRSIRKVALDAGSLTSVLLAKIILEERYQVRPEFISMPPSLPAMLEDCDAAAIIGDTTMCAPSDRWPALDLGEEWHALTGLPLVFAVWAVNPKMASSKLVDVLTRAKAQGLGSLDEISRVEARRLGLPAQTCFRYLSEIMNYDLGDRHMEGLGLFRDKARRHELVPEGPETKLYEPAADGVLQE